MGIFDFLKKNKKGKSDKNQKLDRLHFKGNKEAFEYSNKYFSTIELRDGHSYIGLLAGTGNQAFINVIHKGTPQLVSVLITHNRSGKEVANKDLVIVGVNQVNKPHSIGDLAELGELMNSNREKAEAEIKRMSENSPLGEVIYKLKPVLNLKTMNFEQDI